jgi:dolichol kinase|tara:strand:+ start:108 stop:698 length:591 start_codon:yes stop_codon:yes gene_type:complete
MTSIILQELKRKISHLTILLVIVIYVAIKDSSGQRTALLTLIGILIAFLILEYFRLDLNWKIPGFSQLIRAEEQNKMHSTVYFLSATIMCLAVFDFKIALAALLMAIFGDMIAAMIGKKYGTTLIFKNKTAIGCLSELVVNLLIGIIVLIGIYQAYIIITMAFTATLVETFVNELDDNLLTPLFAGFAGQMIFFII